MDTAERPAHKAGATKEGPVSLSEKIGDIITRSRMVLIGLGVAILVVLFAIAIVTQLRASGDKSAAIRMDQLVRDGSAWSSETDTAKKADLEKKLIAGLDGVVAKHKGSVWAQQAWDMKATIAESRGDWTESEKDWMEASKILPDSFMAPASLQNAAAAAEELGASDRAIQHWKAFVDRYAGKSVGIPHAWFALGRLSEEGKDYVAALSDYEKIVASWPDSDWTKLAKDRILSLRSRGLAK
ncbi:MAG: tetratricopeptide repeat protein [Treponema sp.]|nr:tetratricopeptide repeat protein [Treponema sp.]